MEAQRATPDFPAETRPSSWLQTHTRAPAKGPAHWRPGPTDSIALLTPAPSTRTGQRPCRPLVAYWRPAAKKIDPLARACARACPRRSDSIALSTPALSTPALGAGWRPGWLGRARFQVTGRGADARSLPAAAVAHPRRSSASLVRARAPAKDPSSESLVRVSRQGGAAALAQPRPHPSKPAARAALAGRLLRGSARLRTHPLLGLLPSRSGTGRNEPD